MVLKVFLALEMEFVFFTKDLDDEGLNPKAVEAVETATRRAAVVLNFIGAERKKRFTLFDKCEKIQVYAVGGFAKELKQ